MLLMYMVLVVVASYATFVVFSEQINPAEKPSYYLARRRWRYGRRMAAGMLVIGSASAALYELTQASMVVTLVLAAACFGLFWGLFSNILQSNGKFKPRSIHRPST